MEALIWLASGTLSGWAAGKLMKGRDYGVTGNIILGMLGSLVGGWVFDALGFAGPRDIWRHIAVSLLGAMLTLAVARRLRPVARQTRKAFGEGGTIVDIEAAIRRLGSLERSTLDRVLKRAPARDPNVEFAEHMTFGQRGGERPRIAPERRRRRDRGRCGRRLGARGDGTWPLRARVSPAHLVPPSLPDSSRTMPSSSSICRCCICTSADQSFSRNSSNRECSV